MATACGDTPATTLRSSPAQMAAALLRRASAIVLPALAVLATTRCFSDFVQPPGSHGTAQVKGTRLTFKAQPSSAIEGRTITPEVRVAVLDSAGTVVDVAQTVTIGLIPGSDNAVLNGTTTVQAVDGIATFSDLTITPPGSGYMLMATASGLAPDTSSRFDVFAAIHTPASVTVSPSSSTINTIDSTVQLTAEARDSAGSVMSLTFAWRSSDTTVASVNAVGLVRARSNGAASITATARGVTGSAVVTVHQLTASLRIVGPDTLVSLGDTVTMTVEMRDANGNVITGRAVAWSGNASNVATIQPSTGWVTAVGNGAATIQASVDNMTATKVLTVYQAVATLHVTGRDSLRSINDTVTFTTDAHDARGNPITGRNYAWSSSDGAIATVAATGLVTAKTNGTAMIKAAAPGVADSASITVRQVTASVTVTGADSLHAIGDSTMFSAQAKDAGGTAIAGRPVAWSVDVAAVATIDPATGIAVAAGNGTAAIRATIDGVTGQKALVVFQAVDSITVTPPTFTIAVGDNADLTAQAFDRRGHLITRQVQFQWTSSDATKVSIVADSVDNSKARATRIVDGPVVITATAETKSGASAGN